MIYTVTCNPSLDYVISVPAFQTGALNRTASEQMYAGGKGINVSWVLHELGEPTRALGFTAGFTGAEIERRVQSAGIEADFVRVPEMQGVSRINVKMRSEVACAGCGATVAGADVGAGAAFATRDAAGDIGGVGGAGDIAGSNMMPRETEINGMGPQISERDIAELRRRLDAVTADDMVVLAGNVPKSLPDTLYCNLLKSLGERGVPVVVDASGEQLCSVLPYKPFLVKPNDFELGGLFGVEIHGRDQALEYARRLQHMGPRNVLVSLGADGAVFVGEDGSCFQSPALECAVVNTIGAGDSMVAGFLAGWLQTHQYETAFRWGIGAASACVASLGLPDTHSLQSAGCVL